MTAATLPSTIAVDRQDERRGVLGPGSARNGWGRGGFSFQRAASIRARAEGSLNSAPSAHLRSNSRSLSSCSGIAPTPVSLLEQSCHKPYDGAPVPGNRDGGAVEPP